MAKPARYPLDDKVVLITGAGRGLGACIATEVARRGARVALLDIDEAAAKRTAAELPRGRALGIPCDVTDADSIRSAVGRAVEEFGQVEVSIANAGIMGHGSTFRTLSAEDIEKVMRVNVTGATNTVAATIESVISNRGQIVLISSVFAYINGAGAIPYAMSKAAVSQMGRGLAVELAPHGASAITAYFSLLETDLVREGIDGDPEVLAVMALTPKFFLKRLTPQVAAKAIADGLECRVQRVATPARWLPIAALQGILGPLADKKLSRDAPMHKALLKLEERAR